MVFKSFRPYFLKISNESIYLTRVKFWLMSISLLHIKKKNYSFVVGIIFFYIFEREILRGKDYNTG